MWPFCARRAVASAPGASKCARAAKPAKRRADGPADGAVKRRRCAVDKKCAPPPTPLAADKKCRDAEPLVLGKGSFADRAGRKYLTVRKLGEGSYGSVFEGRHQASGTRVALKKVLFEDGQVTAESLREIQLLQALKSPHVVGLVDRFTTRGGLTLVLELMETDLENVLEKGPLGAAAQRSYARQLLEGVSFLHQRRVLHRDLKPGNLLLKGGELKIADFGLARFQAPTMTSEVVTLWYRAPELLLGCSQYSSGVDMWACGCICVEMGTGTALFQAGTENKMVHAIFSLLGTPGADFPGLARATKGGMKLPPKPRRKASATGCPAGLLGVAQELLVLEPPKRLPARKALRLSYFAGHDVPC